MKTVALFMFCLLVVASTTSAIPAISCHCFRERTFDPSNPSSADGYILATTQNSFFASVFGIEKRGVVQAKMSGTSSEDLWIAYYFSEIKKVSPEKLMSARAESGSWGKAFSEMGLDSVVPRDASRIGNYDLSDSDLASAVADAVLVERLGVSWAVLGSLRQRGAGTKEAILITVLSLKSKQQADQIYDEFIKEGKSWGIILDERNLSPESVGKEVERIVRLLGRMF